MNRLGMILLAGAALLSAAPAFAANTEVDVIVDMSPEGRKVAPPTAAHPAYYLPVMGGYRTMGAVVAGEPPPPPPADIAHLVAETLAQQGYFVVKQRRVKGQMAIDERFPPTLILTINYGYMNPEIDQADPADPSTKVFYNQSQMLALVGGNTLENLNEGFDPEFEEVMQGAERDRYFLAITAYDFQAYVRGRKKVMLWQAKMSVPSNRVTLDQVLPVLAKAGGPMLGRETTRPKMLLLPVTPEGKVIIGTPTVKDYLDAPAPPPPASPVPAPAPQQKPPQ